VHTGLWWRDLRKRDNFEDTDVDGRIMLKSLLKAGLDGVDRIDLAQDRNRWEALVNAVKKTFGFHKMRGIS
jgi:hypothetical protein